MTYLLISALLPFLIAATCLEDSGSCPSIAQGLLQSSKSHQIEMDDAGQGGGLEPLVLMLQEDGARRGGGQRWVGGQGLRSESSRTSKQFLKQLQFRMEAAAQGNKPLSPLEGSLMQALKETLENTTLPALMKGHVDDQKEMNRRVQALTNCNNNYATDSMDARSTKQKVDTKKETHRLCRISQSVLKSKRSDKLGDLTNFTEGLQQPQKPAPLVPTAADPYFAAGLKWFKENQALYTDKKSAYTAAKGEHDQKTETCNQAQTSYESGYCQWIGQATAASKSYTRCWTQGGGNDWNETRAAVLDSAEQRKHEYEAVKKIQCFLSSLLVLSKKAGKVTQKKIDACKALAPDTSIFDVVNTDAPPQTSLTSLGNLTSMPGDETWQKSEYAELRDLKNVTSCAKAVDENDTLIWNGGNITHLCDANEHVRMHRCEPCARGRSRLEGDNAVGADTKCSAIICNADEHVKSNNCVACPAGKTRIAGDDASGADTSCTATFCAANQRVISNACDSCPPGKTNAAGDDASGGNTTCDATLCAENQHVQAHACHACSAGKTNPAGDDASAANTTCRAIKCSRNQYVKSNACHTCAAGRTNAAGNDASGADTQCTATKCSANKKVVSNECKGCPPGKTNRAGDDASGGDTACYAVTCSANQHVQDNACKACRAGTINAAGDDASGPNTKCDAIKCEANQHVLSNACSSCPSGTKNAAGDDASGPDTSCDRTCALYTCPQGYVKKSHGSTSYTKANCCQASRLASYAIGSSWTPFENSAVTSLQTLLTTEITLQTKSVVIFTGHGHARTSTTSGCPDASIFIDGKNPYPASRNHHELQYGGNFIHNTQWVPAVSFAAVTLSAGKHTFELKVKGRPSARQWFRAPVLIVESFPLANPRAWFSIGRTWGAYDNKYATSYETLLSSQITLTSESVVILTAHGHGRVNHHHNSVDASIIIEGKVPNPCRETQHGNSKYQYGGSFNHNTDWVPQVVHTATILPAGSHRIELQVRNRNQHHRSWFRAPILAVASYPVLESKAWYAIGSSWRGPGNAFDNIGQKWTTVLTKEIRLASESKVILTGHGHGRAHHVNHCLIVAIFVDSAKPNPQGSFDQYGAVYTHDSNWIPLLARTATTLPAGKHIVHLKAYSRVGPSSFRAPVLTITAT